MSGYEIYALEHPTMKYVKYVGLSRDAQKRFKQHLRNKTSWVKELLDQGLQPTLRIVENDIQDLATARARERYWISYYEGKGHELVNVNHNMDALCEREHEREHKATVHQNVSARFQNLPSDIAQQMTEMTIQGYEMAACDCGWDDTYNTVLGTLHILKEKGYDIQPNEIDAAKIAFNLFGYEWEDS